MNKLTKELIKRDKDLRKKSPQKDFIFSKFPKLDGKKIDRISMIRWNDYYAKALESLEFDNNENGLSLTDKDINMLAWNIATLILFKGT